MGLFTMQSSMRHEQRKVTVLHSHLGDFSIDISLDLFPEKVSPWTKNVTSRDIVVLNQFTFTNDLDEEKEKHG